MQTNTYPATDGKTPFVVGTTCDYSQTKVSEPPKPIRDIEGHDLCCENQNTCTLKQANKTYPSDSIDISVTIST